VKSHESVTVEIERALKKVINLHNQFAVKLIVHPDLNHYLNGGDRDYFEQFAAKANAHLEFAVNDNLHLNEFIFYSTLNGQKIDV
jgi:ribonuclease G